MHKLIIRYADWTFDFIECAPEEYPALREVIQGAEKCSVVHMKPDADFMWNESYLVQPWHDKE